MRLRVRKFPQRGETPRSCNVRVGANCSFSRQSLVLFFDSIVRGPPPRLLAFRVLTKRSMSCQSSSIGRPCYCRCLVVGMVTVVPIALSVAADVAGSESVRNMSVLRGWNVRRCCGRCTSRSRQGCPWSGGSRCICCSYCCCRCLCCWCWCCSS